jgi:hypothetical protein
MVGDGLWKSWTMTGNTAWHKWSAQLAHRLDRDFERACLPFLRLIWSEMMIPKPLSKWDRQGIDLISIGNGGKLQCVVQCKTSQQTALGAPDVRRAEDSINAFRRSDHACETYLLLINGDGRNAEYNLSIEKQLATLVSSGKAERAELWPRTKLMNTSFARMRQILARTLRERAQERQEIFRGLFRFGHVYLPDVPVQEEELILKLGVPCERRNINPVSTRILTQLLQDSSTARWTLLTGVFGAGKTTTALEASSAGEYTTIFVSAADLGERARRQGTSTLAQDIIDALRMFDGDAGTIDGFQVIDPEDEEIFTQLAGPALASLLRSETPEHVLLLDGLDENRVYLHPDGLQILNNQLAELKCPIVLTTRFEHLSAMFGNFEALLQNLARKGSSTRPARLLTLAPWTRVEVRRFVEEANRTATNEEKGRLAEFLSALDGGLLLDLYGDLPFHPLFLQFVLEDICSTGLNSRSRTELIGSWVERKIWRDVDHHGIPTDEPMDRYELIGRMLLLMEAVAGVMTTGETEVQLTENIDASQIETLSVEAFGKKIPSLTLLLYGVLVPVSLRKSVRLEVRFALRVLQEYFLACKLKRSGRDTAPFPRSVQEFVDDLPQSFVQ